jgi:hypothetical protein
MLRYCKTFGVAPKEAEQTLTYGDILEFEAFEKMESSGKMPQTLLEHYLDQMRQLLYINASLQIVKGKVSDFLNPAGSPESRLEIEEYKQQTLEEIQAREKRRQEIEIAKVRAMQKAADQKKKC